jgi:hypothetical protein
MPQKAFCRLAAGQQASNRSLMDSTSDWAKRTSAKGVDTCKAQHRSKHSRCVCVATCQSQEDSRTGLSSAKRRTGAHAAACLKADHTMSSTHLPKAVLTGSAILCADCNSRADIVRNHMPEDLNTDCDDLSCLNLRKSHYPRLRPAL